MQTGKLLREKIEESAAFIRGKVKFEPSVGIVLGTGMGEIARRVKDAVVIPYDQIPHFPKATAVSHAGNFVFGTFAGKKVALMEGRFHYYEGHTLEEITFPVRVLKAIGVNILILSNAAGGMNPEYTKGDIVAVTDHINFMGVSPLIGPNDNNLGPRFPDMIEPYSKRLIAVAESAAKKKNVPLKKGVYIGVTGPNLETRAEYRFMRMIGADVVGMSTVPEVIVGVHCGLEMIALSIVTDVCLPDTLEPVNIEEIIKVAQKASVKLDALVEGIVEEA